MSLIVATMSLIVRPGGLIVATMSPFALIVHNEPFTMNRCLIIRLIA